MPEVTWWMTAHGTTPSNHVFGVKVDPARIQGTRGIFGPSLTMIYSIDTNDAVFKGARLISLEGWLAWHSEYPGTTGIQIPPQVVTWNPVLRIPLTDEQIEAIEERRSGDAVMLNVSLAGIGILPRSIQSGAGTEVPETRVVTQNGNQELVRIEREHWLKILEALGAGKRRLVELPEPTLPHNDTRWAECLRLLDSAILGYRRREYEQAILHCRKAIEGIAEVLGRIYGRPKKTRNEKFEDWVNGIKDKLMGLWPSERESPKMLAALLSGAFTWTSPQAHYGHDMPVREEASFGLSITTDLLMFAGQLVAAHPSVPMGNAQADNASE